MKNISPPEGISQAAMARLTEVFLTSVEESRPLLISGKLPVKQFVETAYSRMTEALPTLPLHLEAVGQYLLEVGEGFDGQPICRGLATLMASGVDPFAGQLVLA